MLRQEHLGNDEKSQEAGAQVTWSGERTSGDHRAGGERWGQTAKLGQIRTLAFCFSNTHPSLPNGPGGLMHFS